MGSRLLCAALYLALYVGTCSCQSTIVLEWTDTANANFTQFMSTVQFKANDTLRFNNTNVKDHDVLQVTSQADYDACNANNETGWTVNAGESYEILFSEPVYRVWIIDTQSCAIGQKVEFTVLNADGTAVLPDTGANPPSLNAPQPDPDSPPTPPAPPLGVAGGPSPNAAVYSQPSLLWSMLAALLAACYRF